MVILNNLRRWTLGLYSRAGKLGEVPNLGLLVDVDGIERDIILYGETSGLFNFITPFLGDWRVHIGLSTESPKVDDYRLLDEIANFPVTERDVRLNPDGTLSLILRGEWEAPEDYWIYEWGLSLTLKCDDGVVRRFLMVREVTLAYEVRAGEKLRVGWIVTY